MRYEAMGKAPRRMLNIPQLLGGLNTAVDAEFIDDDELVDVRNLRIDHGALRTREAVRAFAEPLMDEEVDHLHASEILRHPIEIDGELCTVVLATAEDTAADEPSLKTVVDVVSLSGERKQRYDCSVDASCVAVAPCNRNDHDALFLMYANSNIYACDREKGIFELSDKEWFTNGQEEIRLYAPLVMINGRSVRRDEFSEVRDLTANGVMYEGYNRLTGAYRAQFTPSVGSKSEEEFYKLPTRLSKGSRLYISNVSALGENDSFVWVGTSGTFTIDRKSYTISANENGTVQVTPPFPASDIANTVTFTCFEDNWENTMPATLSMATWFGGTANKRGGTRLFLVDADNAKLLWSDVNNPFYFPENNYMIVGDASQKITALEKQGDMLVIFKEREIFYTTYVQGEIDTEAVANGVNVDVTATQAYFPLTQLSPQIGCRCPRSIALCRDRLVWLDSDARVYTLVVSGQYSERNVREIGQKVRPYLLNNTEETQRKKASAIDHNGKYRVLVGNVMAEFDYNDSGFVNVSSYYSGERAARNIAWMIHRYHFDKASEQEMISDGADAAIIVSTLQLEGSIVRFLYRFNDALTTDAYIVTDEDNASNYYPEQKPIEVSLTTKTYEFGDPAAFKRIHALYPMLQTDGAELQFLVDGVAPRYGTMYRSRDTFAHLILPGVGRCRTFAVKLQATGKLCLKGLRMQYSMLDYVK